MKKPWKIDVPVLLIFFARHETFEKVFEAVRQARPSTLLLWQDGPREGREDDLVGIQKCREIAENVDWDCTVYKKYNEKNYGCDPSTFYSHKWAFSLVDKCIILEDDMVADESFFRYCKELLDKYENDQRINHICGINFFGEMEECPNDYLFAYNGTGAWASWRRVAEEWDETYSFLDKTYYIKNLKTRGKELFATSYKTALNRRSIGKAYWETLLGMNCMLQNRLVIIPKRNMVTNIGLDEKSTHGANPKLLPKKVRRLFNAPVYAQTFPLKHPEYIVLDNEYYQRMRKEFGYGSRRVAIIAALSYALRCVFYGELGRIGKALIRRLRGKGEK